MKFLDLLRAANRNLLRAKLRTFLTVGAVFIGSFALILTNGIGDGFRDYVDKQVRNIDSGNTILVQKRPPGLQEELNKQESVQGQSDSGAPVEYKEDKTQDNPPSMPPSFDPKEMTSTLNEMKEKVSGIEEVVSVAPAMPISVDYIQIGNSKKYETQIGVKAAGTKIKVEAGKDIDGKKQVILPFELASVIDTNLENLLGKTATISYQVKDQEESVRRNLEVVGIATKGMIANNNSYIDSSSAMEIYSEQIGVPISDMRFTSFELSLNSSDPEVVKRVSTELEGLDLTTISLQVIQDAINQVILVLQIVFGFFAMIALLAASFGIINTLVIAVLERTKLIGLQKALGMGRAKIFALFSLESILLGFWGAFIGMVAAIIFGLIANRVIESWAEEFVGEIDTYRVFVFKPLSLILVLLLVSAIAFFAGVIPAYRASKLDPIKALRYE